MYVCRYVQLHRSIVSVHACVHLFVRGHIRVHVYFMGCTCMLVPIYVSSCVHVDASAYVYVRVNVYNEYEIIYVCMCVRMHGCMCKCIYTM